MINEHNQVYEAFKIYSLSFEEKYAQKYKKELRFLVWEYFLSVQHSCQEYETMKQQNHILYQQKKQQMLKVSRRDPLQSPNTDYEEQEDLINKDIERTFQEQEIFQDKQTQVFLRDILCCWIREPNNISYKQGMNDILGMIVQVYLDFRSILDEEAEAQVFFLFSAILSNHQTMFEYQGKKNTESPIHQRIKIISNHNLKIVDFKVFQVLKLEETQMQIFLLRWIRCMLAREFSIEQTKIIWDHIFLNNHIYQNQFQYLDCMVLAMITRVREKILYHKCMTQYLPLLLNYPDKDAYQFIINEAYNVQILLKLIENGEEIPLMPNPSIIQKQPNEIQTSHDRTYTQSDLSVMDFQVHQEKDRSYCWFGPQILVNSYQQIYGMTSNFLSKIKIIKKKSTSSQRQSVGIELRTMEDCKENDDDVEICL